MFTQGVVGPVSCFNSVVADVARHTESAEVQEWSRGPGTGTVEET